MAPSAQHKKILPYGRQSIDEADIAAVVEVLNSDWLTTGPAVDRFEKAIAEQIGAREAVAVSNGTAALHAAFSAIGIGEGDEVIVPPITFVATANAVVYCGGTPIFADVAADTLLLDPACVEQKITPRTKAICAVDYAGQPCDYRRLRAIAEKHNLALIADACHSLGASDHGTPVGSLADLTIFSFHPVKQITSGEGGLITTDNSALASAMRTFRNHGITTDHRQRAARGTWYYEMSQMGFNYRMSDIHAALGASQLRKLDSFIERRRAIAARYETLLSGLPGVEPLAVRDGAHHAYHLFVVRIDSQTTGLDRGDLFAALRTRGISAAVHYIPVHQQPFYREHFGTADGLCSVAEQAYSQILSLPIFPEMRDDDVDFVVGAMHDILIDSRSNKACA